MAGSTIKFSLVIATVGRTHHLTRLLESLKAQTYQNFEVIIVDQNPLGFLNKILAPFQGLLPIVHLRSAVGLSLARNVGLGHITGDVVAFPDDDCWYPSDVLDSVSSRLTKHTDWDGLTGQLVDPEDPAGFPWYHRTSGPVTLNNLWHRSTSVTIFLRRRVVESVGNFDRNLGRGTTTGMFAAEESDYLIRVLKHGLTLHYSADICLYHESLPNHHKRRRALAFGEGQAFGYVLGKYDYPFLFVIRTWIRALGGAAHALLYGRWPRVGYYQATLWGRILGWHTGARSSRGVAKEIGGKEGRYQAHNAESLRLEQAEGCSGAQVGST